MSKLALNTRLLPALALALAALAGPVAPAAHAQQVMRMAVTGGGPMFGGTGRPAMTPKDLGSYSGILGFDEAQKEAAKELLASYTADFEKATKEHGEKMKQVSEEYRETKDDEVWQQLTPANEKFAKRSKELESNLLSDLKTLCSEQQLNQWPKMERTRRRDRTIERGSVSGESVDLVQVVRALELTGEAKKQIADQLETYEQDLDKALIERNKILEEQSSGFGPGKMTFDMEKFQENMKKAREAGEKVRDINQRYARNLEGVLPEDMRARFQMDVKRASFPQVYRQSRAQRAFDATLKFSDLDAKQREAVASLRQSYEQDLGTLNDKWAAAIAEDEKTDGGVIGFGGGAVMKFNFGDEDDSKPSAQARKARREADRKALASLQSLLSDEQKERLPKAEDTTAPTAGFVIGR